MIKNYIWDFDGTLYDTYPIMLDAIMRTLKEMAIPAGSAEIYRTLKEFSSKQITDDRQMDYQAFSQQFHAYEALDPRKPKSFPGTKETLARLKARGGQHFIMTHRPVVSTIDLLELEGLTAFFTEIVGPENDFPRKPDPTAIEYIVTAHHLVPEETVMIGDRLLDVEAGKKAGVKTCFFDVDGFLKNIPADYTVHSMAEVLQVFQ